MHRPRPVRVPVPWRQVRTPASNAALRPPPPRGRRLPWRELRREPGGPEEGAELASLLESLASVREGAHKISESLKMPSTPDTCIIEVWQLLEPSLIFLSGPLY